MEVILVNENDNLFEVLANEGIDIRKIDKQISTISRKVKNNRVGYFQFKTDEGYVKICVLPKILNKYDKSEYISQQFLKYMKLCIQIMYKYHKQEHLEKNIEKNYIDVIAKVSGNDIESLDSIFEMKYLYVLKNIECLLNKMMKYIYNNKEF